jgi:hypothetical protein
MTDPTRSITLPSGVVVATAAYVTIRLALRLAYAKPNALALMNRLSDLIDNPGAQAPPGVDEDLQKLGLLDERGLLHDDVRAIVQAEFDAEPEVQP